MKIIQKSLMKNLKSDSKNTFKFSDNDVNKFILFLRKGIYPYEWLMVGKSLMKQN